jgi:hypothetical protein
MKQEFAKELAELINRHGLEREFNDTPDYILAGVAIEAMEQFARNSAKRDDWHGFRTADYKKKRDAILNRTNEQNCEGCSLVKICPDAQIKRQPEPERKREYKKPEAFDVPKEVQAMAEFFGDMFPGTKVEIHRVEMPRRNPRDRRRGKNKRNRGGNNGKN